MSAIDFWAAEHRRLPGGAPPWLAALRRRALARFADEGWPTARQEAWHHSSLEFLSEFELAAAVGAAPETLLSRLSQDDDGAHWLVFVDGRYAPALSSLDRLPAGAHVGSLADALAKEPESVAEAFGRAEDGDSPSALNAALAADGAWIRLASGVELASPIHLVFIFAAAAQRHLRNVITVEAGASASIVEHYPDNGEAQTLTTAATRILLGADSRIEHVKLQQQSPLAIHLARIDVEQARGSRLASHSLSFGARLARTDIQTRLAGEGAEALLNGLYHADGRRHVDHHTRIDHAQPQTTSREYYRGLLDGNARGVFAGRIVVARDAQRSDARQRCDSLLLSRSAETDARPELEIYADDVKCAHAATVGQLDEDALFYLCSRGIAADQARQLLIYAFAREAIARIGQTSLQRLGRRALHAILPGAEFEEDSP